FAKPLTSLVKFSLNSELYSHILLVPFISAYLIWLRRPGLVLEGRRSWLAAALTLGLGLLLLIVNGVSLRSGWRLQPNEQLALLTLSFLLFLLGGGFLFFGVGGLRRMTFPLAFLFFMVPFPALIERGTESFLQHGSAEAAYALFKLSGMPVF